MKPHRTLLVASLLLVLSLILSACGPGQLLGPAFTPTPAATATPTITPTPAPAVGVPVSNERWQVTVTKVHKEISLKGFNSTYSPKEGNTFLVVDVDFENLDSTQKTEISSKTIALQDESGSILTADGAGSGFGVSSSYCIGCTVTQSSEGKKISMSLVFVVQESTINQMYKFQFGDFPLIPIKLD